MSYAKLIEALKQARLDLLDSDRPVGYIDEVLAAAPAHPFNPTTEQVEFGLHCNLEDCSDDEAAGFKTGVAWSKYMVKKNFKETQ